MLTLAFLGSHSACSGGGAQVGEPAHAAGGGTAGIAGAASNHGGAISVGGGGASSLGGGTGRAGAGGASAGEGGGVARGGTANGGGAGGASGSAGNGGAGSSAGGASSTATQIVARMGVGWNLGNTLDSLGVKDETGWGNPMTTQAMIDALKQGGFTSLRVPTSWDDHFSGSDYTIDPAWLNRVEQVANYGLNDGMYVIVNIHHQNGWENTTQANEATAKDHLVKLWTQIANHFRAYDQHLIFETMNEPRNDDDWTGKQEYYDVVNRLNAAAVATIRGTGGNNAMRLIMVPSYVASPQVPQITALILPSDPMLAVSTHSYIPYSFALDSTGTASFGDTSEIDSTFQRLKTMFIDKGIPVVMGEWASTNKNNLTDRVNHARYYVKSAKAAGFPTFWWDNQNFVANTSDAMGLFDREALNFKFPEIKDAILSGLQ